MDDTAEIVDALEDLIVGYSEDGSNVAHIALAARRQIHDLARSTPETQRSIVFATSLKKPESSCWCVSRTLFKPTVGTLGYTRLTKNFG